MISTRFISILHAYLRRTFGGIASLFSSSWSSLPYIFSMGEFRKEVTEQYPDPVSSRNQEDLPARSRGLLENDINKCTGCGDCARICPVKCITVESESGPDIEKVWVSRFDIDFGNCIFCGICVDVCVPRSLTHTRYFEIVGNSTHDLVRNMGWGPISPELREKWKRLRSMEGFE